MKTYNYLENVKNSVIDYISENIDISDFKNREELSEKLNEECFISDSVTGNASGSFTFSSWDAEENVCHNLGLLSEAVSEFGCDTVDILDKGAEWCDVTIRCYVLPQAIELALDELDLTFSEE